MHQRSYGHSMGETSLERCSSKYYQEVLSRGCFASPIEDDRFGREEFANLKTIMDCIYAECSVEEYVSCDDDTVICAGLIDPSNPNWRSEVRSELLDDDLDFQFVSEDASNDEDYDKELEEPSIKSRAKALRTTDPLRHFAQFNGYQDLALAVRNASHVISSLQLCLPKR